MKLANDKTKLFGAVYFPLTKTIGISSLHFCCLMQAAVLSRVRHPNLVQLVGICPESRSLIYEYSENGSIEDRLVCRGNSPPLPWQSRVKMAIDICAALIFLHSNNPCIVHGNLTLTNILLDANYVSKLSNLGIFRFIPRDASPEASIYVDPEFHETGEFTTESDVFSFGIVWLCLLTGRPALGIIKDVKCALEKGNFKTILDFSAGDWPLELAKQSAHLALRCCAKKRLDRPNLITDVWSLIEPMRGLCTSSSLESEGKRRIPSQFVCPIFQVIIV